MNLATYLDQKRLSQAEFGRMIGKRQSYVSDIIRGVVWPSRSAMVDITKATRGKVTANDFLPTEHTAEQRT